MDQEQTPPYAQSFEIDDYRTRIVPNPPSDPLARIEQQLADLIHVVESLQRRLDSIDATLARFLVR